MRKFFSLILATIVLTAGHAQKTELRLNLEKGKDYKQLTDVKTTIIQDINGQKVTMEISLKGAISHIVTAVNENDYDIDVKYESLNMTMQMPQGKMEFSSAKKDEQDIFSKILAEMINKSF